MTARRGEKPLDYRADALQCKVLDSACFAAYFIYWMNEFRQSVANALRYWETRRVLYNAVLTAVAAGWVILTWPHFRSVQLMGIPPGDTHPALMILIILAILANVCYSAAYLVDIPLQLTFATWRKYRWALLLTGILIAILVENYWIADEIYPFVPR